MPYNWPGRHEFELSYVDDLMPVSNIALIGCDVTSLDHAHLRVEYLLVSFFGLLLFPKLSDGSLDQCCC